MKDAFGDRIKRYESVTTDQKFIPRLPVIVRIDGKSFHSYTRGLDRPFDVGFMDAMIRTAMDVAEESCAVMAYTQSDEITLILYSDDHEKQIYFDGKVHKIVSTLAGLASAKFNQYMGRQKLGWFDCRAFQVPTLMEAVNVLIWRESDAAKNSIQMVARAHYSPKELAYKKIPDLHEMLYQKGINWNDLTPAEKRGTYILKRPVQINGTIRRKYMRVYLPQLSTISNQVDVIFNAIVPITPDPVF